MGTPRMSDEADVDMDRIEELSEELGVGSDDNFGIPTQYAMKQGREMGDPATLIQARQMEESVPHQLGSSRFSTDTELFDIAERVESAWPEADVRFGGVIGWGGYIDTMYLLYDNVSDIAEFEEYVVLRFKSEMRGGKDENKGISPVADDRVTFSHQRYRKTSSDEYLLVSTDDVLFEEKEDYGKLVRVWWDD